MKEYTKPFLDVFMDEAIEDIVLSSIREVESAYGFDKGDETW